MGTPRQKVGRGVDPPTAVARLARRKDAEAVGRGVGAHLVPDRGKRVSERPRGQSLGSREHQRDRGERAGDWPIAILSRGTFRTQYSEPRILSETTLCPPLGAAATPDRTTSVFQIVTSS
jgi:hypothetical protein